MIRTLLWSGMRVGMGGAVLLVTALGGRAAYIDHNFDGYGVGMPFTGLVDQWQASTSTVVVTNAPYVSASRSVWLPRKSAISNAVAVVAPAHVWTELRFIPHLGVEPLSVPTNTAASVHYVDTNGFVNVWRGSGWLVCSNDVWGDPVPALVAGAWAELALYHHFGAGKTALMVNDQVVVQDLPFLNPLANYAGFAVNNGAVTNVFLDDVYIQPTFDVARHASNRNGDALADAAELDAYGYVARTLYVGAGRPYATLVDALAVARDRDVIDVLGGAYTDTATITQDVTITGGSFTNAGTLTVAAGATVTAGHDFQSGLSVAGTLTFASGVAVTAAPLAVTGGGLVVSTGGDLVAPGDGVHLVGSFTVDSTWGTVASMPLDFTEDFERYANGSVLANLGFRGWGASTSAVTVVGAAGVGVTKGAVMTETSVLSNRIATAATKVWTDCYVRPQPGLTPTESLPTPSAACMGYVSSNGWLVLWNGGGWVTCSNDYSGTPFAALSDSAYVRLTLHCNYTTHKAAVFLAGRLAGELIAFPAGPGLSTYSGFAVANRGGETALDNLLISSALPPDLTLDLDGDGVADAYEIDLYDSLGVYDGPRTVIMFH